MDRRLRRPGDAIARLHQDGHPTRGLRAVLAHHLIFRFNRSGLSGTEQAAMAALACNIVFHVLIGPAAAALRLASSPGRAMAASAAIGTVVTWIGILLAYDSYYWPPSWHRWPVSFFVVALVLIAYLLSYARRPRRRPDARGTSANQQEEAPACSPA